MGRHALLFSIKNEMLNVPVTFFLLHPFDMFSGKTLLHDLETGSKDHSLCPNVTLTVRR